MCSGRGWQAPIRLFLVYVAVLLSVSLGPNGAAAAIAAAGTAAAAAAAGTAAAELEAAAAAAGAAAASLAPEYAWFERHVASRCFGPPDATWKLEDAAKETVLHRQTQFFGVYEQPEGFYYYYSTTTKQTEFDILNGGRMQAAKVSANMSRHISKGCRCTLTPPSCIRH